MLMGLFSTPALAAADTEGHWAEEVIEKWTDAGLVKGYEDGSFRPNNPVTRAEFMTMANRAFDYSKEGEASFKDVSSDDWFYGSVVSAADYISGYPDETMRPNNPISRQEVAKILASIAHLKADAFEAADFTDAASFADWSKGAIAASSAKSFVNGYPDGSFKPLANITRAEALKALDNTMAKVSVISKATEVKDATYAGSLVLAHEDITLTDVIVEGDLIIGEEVGDGDIHLNDVVVKGETHVRGGGLNSVYIDGGSYQKVVVSKSGSGVRVVCTNNEGVEVTLDVPDSEVVLEGDFEKVEVKTEGIKLSFQGETTVGELKIDEKATNTEVKTDEKVVLKKAVVESKTDFTGEGTIDEAEGKEAEDSSFEKKPDVVNNEPTEPAKKPSGSSGGSSKPANVSVTDIALNKTVEVILPEGAKAKLIATVSPSNATNKNVTWSSVYEDIASVEDGVVTAVAYGKTTITAKAGGETATAEINVIEVEDLNLASPTIVGFSDQTEEIWKDGVVTGIELSGLEDLSIDIEIPANIGTGGIIEDPKDPTRETQSGFFVEVSFDKADNTYKTDDPTDDSTYGTLAWVTGHEQGNIFKKSILVDDFKEYFPKNVSHKVYARVVYFYEGINDEGNWETLGLDGPLSEPVEITYKPDVQEVSGTVTSAGKATGTVSEDKVTFASDLEIPWYDADDGVGRTEGNRVGVNIHAPVDFDTTDVTVRIGETTHDWKDIKDGDGTYFGWWPLITETSAQEYTATVKWNEESTQVFTIVIEDGVTLEYGDEQAAVKTAEDSELYSDVVAAEELVNALEDGDVKTSLKGRVQAVWSTLATGAKDDLTTKLENLDWDTLITAVHFYDKANASGADVTSLTTYYAGIESMVRVSKVLSHAPL